MMNSSLPLKSTLGSSHNVNLDDVLMMKNALNKAGLYKIPSYGMNTYPDQALFDSIKALQRIFGLTPDGVMRPGDKTVHSLENLLRNRGSDQMEGGFPGGSGDGTESPNFPGEQRKLLPGAREVNFSAKDGGNGHGDGSGAHGYDPNQPRDWHGRWTDTGAGQRPGDSSSQIAANDRPDANSTPSTSPGKPSEAAKPKPWEGTPNEEFRNAIAEAEQSGNAGGDGYPDRTSSTNALGRYQILSGPLADTGWKKDGSWTSKAEEHGVKSDDDFLKKPAAQEEAFTDYMRNNEKELEAKGVYSRIGQTYTGVKGQEITVTEAGLAGAVHRRGARKVNDYFKKLDSYGGSTSGQKLTDVEKQVETRLRTFQKYPYQRLTK